MTGCQVNELQTGTVEWVSKQIATLMVPMMLAWIIRILSKINERMTRAEAWVSAHEKSDDEREANTMRKFDEVRHEIHSSRRSNHHGTWED